MFQIEVNSSEVNTLIRSCDSRVIDFDIDNWPLKEYGRLIFKFFLPLNISIMRQDGKQTFSGFIATMITSQSCAGIRYECKNEHAIFFPPTMNERSFETKWHDHHQHNATGTYPRQDSYIRFPILSWISETVSLRRGNKS